jgi:hypothetical protein
LETPKGTKQYVIQYTEADKALMWERWQQGESLIEQSSGG